MTSSVPVSTLRVSISSALLQAQVAWLLRNHYFAYGARFYLVQYCRRITFHFYRQAAHVASETRHTR